MQAQNINGYPGLLRTSLTIAPGRLLDHGQSYIYLHGFLELFPEAHVSLRGDIYQMVTPQTAGVGLKQNTHLLYGAAIHHNKGISDLYAGLEPGISFTQTQTLPINFLPTWSVFTGYHLSVWKYFNLFAEARLLSTRYSRAPEGNIRLNELLFSAGLGFQVPLKKLCCPQF